MKITNFYHSHKFVTEILWQQIILIYIYKYIYDKTHVWLILLVIYEIACLQFSKACLTYFNMFTSWCCVVVLFMYIFLLDFCCYYTTYKLFIFFYFPFD